MNRSAIPNILSGFRILLVPPAIWMLIAGRYPEATIIITLAVSTDVLDGFLARHFGWRSRAGAILDPVADKLLFASVFLALGYLGHVEVWLMALVIGRDVIIGAGAYAYKKLIGPVVASPSFISKMNTLMLFFFTAALLLKLSGMSWVREEYVQALRAVVVFTVVSSGLQYIWSWGYKAWQARTSNAG